MPRDIFSKTNFSSFNSGLLGLNQLYRLTKMEHE